MTMTVQISEGIKLEVEAFYQPQESNPENKRFKHMYKVTIKNYNDFPVQFLHRKWIMKDSMSDDTEIRTERILESLPSLHPSERYTYIDTCELTSEIGSMQGIYMFKNILTERIFQIEIEEFTLENDIIKN